ncbi:hypothetical protein [Fusobacterium hwasookii]|uniref:Uncharacterized protein n=1 Tax=Fusobacterium hwasookii ChDC F206 TaxID=1307443 RepID=A0AAC9A183_9FUSO|nr:hypothetical protein [Fusobacterium hwasookii]ALQ35554.1 hypothetical protein RN92_06495 [Fusobacterium hwasookii ChDC F206]ALQ37812.1 hypothetical protein RN97_06220 [Fusobacterium hwasookii ChDC F300]QNE68293.1 hypothetical protein H5V38_10340 [Fusobacterium hwasookii]
MKIKIKLESLENILNLSNSFCTIPIMMDKSMMFGAYGVDLNMSEYIWYQLPEECKNKVYNYKEHTIKAMIITLTNISAYSVTINHHEKFKEAITMEEFYKDFSENKKIENFLCECDFPYSNMSIYFQNLGEIYAEFELEDWVCYEKEVKEEWKIKERERRKIREIYELESISLEKLEEKEERFQIFICNVHMSGKISKEDFEKIFSTYPLILTYLSLDFLILILKKAEELGIEIPDNMKYDIGYCLADLQTEIATEEEKKSIEEIRKKWNLKKVYED